MPAISIGFAAERVQRTCALSDSVSRLRFVSAARQEALEKMGLSRVRDLLLHVPHRYLDFSQVTPIGYTTVGEQTTIVATVDKVRLKRPKPKMQIVELSVVDETGVLIATFFKQPWIAEHVHAGDTVALSGKVGFSYGFKEMKAPFYEVLGSGGEGAGSYARVLPVHSLTEGLSAAWMRRIMSSAVADLGDVCDWVPAALVARRGLLSFSRAVREVHFPASLAAAERARRRLAYDELLCLQLALLTRTQLENDGVAATAHVTDGPHMAALLGALPFTLSNEQRAAADDILADMRTSHVMNRLLLGDVGTGKTAVAAVALAAAADTGTQAAVMAPTSVLATQYAEKIGPVLDAAHISWRLITGATPAGERAASQADIAAGRVTVVFGTTAILSDALAFDALSLVIIDEQHRFGVDQRAALRLKGPGADLLAMTATPIPRTLALSLYGDIAISRISKRPRAGAGVTTHVATPTNADLAWGAIRDAQAKGQQAYVICPLVDDRDDGEGLDDVPEHMRTKSAYLTSATSMEYRLRTQILPGMSIGLLHGRMSSAEKDRVMAEFKAGRIDVLVSTTVVEVGVDVPNATAMVVMDADRFGLATLHQLRGRVGRGGIAGTVWLVSAAKKGSPARDRLAALEKTSDGFELADLDLKLRHEGDVLGYRQSGSSVLKICDLAADADLVEAAHADAREIAGSDPGLKRCEHRLMALEVMERYGTYFKELERA